MDCIKGLIEGFSAAITALILSVFTAELIEVVIFEANSTSPYIGIIIKIAFISASTLGIAQLADIMKRWTSLYLIGWLIGYWIIAPSLISGIEFWASFIIGCLTLVIKLSNSNSS